MTAYGTKLKWISGLNPETYRVAVVTKKGILEVKRVTDGAGYCHDYLACTCRPCSEMALSHKLGIAMPPWQTQAPLVKTFFETEADWRGSLPTWGNLTIELPPLTNAKLKRLCSKPLEATTDELKLEELERRFPGGTFVLTTDRFYELTYKPNSVYGDIHCEDADISAPFFWHFGGSEKKTPLMVEWRGLFIDLSHLF
jgi:hypothetical protein